MDNFDLLDAAVAACSEQKDNTYDVKDECSDRVKQSDTSVCKNTGCELQHDTINNGGECKHSIIISNGNKVCEFCGLELPREIDNSKEWRYYGAQDTRHNGDPSRCHMRKIDERTINKDVEHMGFSDKIIERANSIYEEV